MAARTPEAIQRHRERNNARRLANPELYNARSRKWYQDNKGPELRAERAAYSKKRYNSDPVFKLAHCMRIRLGKVFGQKKSKITKELVGCDFEFLKTFLEQKFQEGMSWNNYGAWEVDHIVPLASANDEEQVKKLCHYTNLQPMWSLENKKKLKKVG